MVAPLSQNVVAGGGIGSKSLTKNFRRNSLTDTRNPDNGNVIKGIWPFKN